MHSNFKNKRDEEEKEDVDSRNRWEARRKYCPNLKKLFQEVSAQVSQMMIAQLTWGLKVDLFYEYGDFWRPTQKPWTPLGETTAYKVSQGPVSPVKEEHL